MSIILLLVAADACFLAWQISRPVPAAGSTTNVGLDSLNVILLPGKVAARLENGRWQPDLAKGSKAEILVQGMGPGERRLVLITLGPRPSFGQFIRVLRDLKARKICNVLIREDGKALRSQVPLPDGSRDALEIPALVLCGNAIGDAGFSGTLREDGPAPGA